MVDFYIKFREYGTGCHLRIFRLVFTTYNMTLHSAPLNSIQSTVIDTRKDGNHTDYVIRIQTKVGCSSDGDIVYRRFSAFKQLQRLVQRHVEDRTYCCGGSENCLLATFVAPAFCSTEFTNNLMQGSLSVFTKNSKSVVNERKLFLNSFLQSLEDALEKCPPLVIQRCESENCRLSKLLKSFFGCIASPRLVRASSV